MRRRPSESGFSLIELVIVSGILGSLVAGIVGVFRTHTLTYRRQEMSVAMEDNLRIAATQVRDELRRAGYGVPPANLGVWIPTTWAAGFGGASAVVLTQGAGTAPDTISIAACTASPVASLAAAYATGTTLTVGSGEGSRFDTANRRMIRVGDDGFAWVTAVSGDTLTFDQAPGGGNDPFARGFAVGTPVCRVEVVTFAVTAGALTRDRNQGAGAEPVADGIVDLQITASGARARIAVTARTEAAYPGTGSFLTATLVSDVTVRNAP